MRDSQSQPNVSRRSILAGMASATAVGSIGLTSASRTQRAGTSTSLTRRSFDDPISINEINRIRSQKIDEFNQNNKNQTKVSPSFFVGSPGGRIVSYACQIDEQGILHHSVGIASNPHDVDRAHRDAHAEKIAIEQNSKNTYSLTGAVTTQSTNTGWTTAEDGKVTNYSSPHGQLVDYFHWKQSSDTGSALLYKEQFSMFPGAQVYNSNYENHWGMNKQQWSPSSPDVELMDWAPENGVSGSTSFTASESGTVSTTGGSVTVGFSYTYSQPAITMRTLPNGQENYARWTISPHTGAKRQTVSFDPSSIGDFQNGSLNRCVTVTSKATFQHTNGTKHKMTNIAGYDYPDGGCSGCA